MRNDTIEKTIAVGVQPTDIAITVDVNYAYVTNQGSSSISVIDLNKKEVIKVIEVADNPIMIYLLDFSLSKRTYLLSRKGLQMVLQDLNPAICPA